MNKITKDFLSLLKRQNWYNEKYDGRRREFRGIDKESWEEAKKKAIYRRFCRTKSYDYVVSQIRIAYLTVKDRSKPEHGSYQKVAMYGYTWLYLCSPIYGHSDYNKSRLLPIKGHEKECEWLIKVSEKTAKSNV